MSLPLNPLKGTFKEFTSDVYNKKTDNENCCQIVLMVDNFYQHLFHYMELTEKLKRNRL